MTEQASLWIENSPPHWSRGRIKNMIATAANGIWGIDPTGDGTDVRCVRAADFDRARRRVKEDGLPLRSIDPATLLQHRLNPGDLILEKSGGGEKQPVGMAVLYSQPDPAVCSNFCSRIVPAPGIDSRFLTYVFSAAYSQGLTESAIKQTTGIQNLDAGALFASAWSYPESEEQGRIADFLDAETSRMDRLNSLRLQQIDLLEEGWMGSWADIIRSDAEKSQWVPIRRFITAITDGPFGSSLTSAHYSDSGVRVIRLGNIGRAEYREREPAYISEDYFTKLRRHEAVAGDLIIAGLGDQKNPLGRSCTVPPNLGTAMVKADCFRVRLDQRKVLHEYAAWALSSPPVTDQVALLARGSTRARINLEVVREVMIPVPTTEQQQLSVARMSTLRSNVKALTTRLHRQLELLAERRQALITAAVTGQFDVSTASGRGVDVP
ncbi:hypothetical protein [Kitasatospora purpeofusca]|uniref:hypothetical protein n=1 Tax=Kitasatospora purpeofusca TaxID=67352 RepID=UPI003F4A9E10